MALRGSDDRAHSGLRGYPQGQYLVRAADGLSPTRIADDSCIATGTKVRRAIVKAVRDDEAGQPPMKGDAYTAPHPIGFDHASRDASVLVGFDGSHHSTRALHYGALVAQRSGRTLTVITAFKVPASVYTMLTAVPDRREADAAMVVAREVLATARTHLQDYPGKVYYRAERGDAAGVLVDLSAVAELIVIGSRGRGGFAKRILGSVASALPAHAFCPVIVVPPGFEISNEEGAAQFVPQPDQRPVTVGIDGSQRSRVAALQAAETALNCGAELRMLMALPSLEGWVDWYPELDNLDKGFVNRRRTELETKLEAEIEWVSGHYPFLPITAAVRPGDPVALLSRATHEAQLTVLGTRGRGPFTGSLLGSVSRGVLLRAGGPVMIVPDLRDKRLADQPTSY